MSNGDQTAGEGAGEQAIETPTDQNVDQSGDQIVTGNDVGSELWHQSLPEDQFNERDRGVLKRFDSVDALARGYMNAFNLVGRDKIPMPNTPDEWQEVFSRLGRPDESSGYDLKVMDTLPEPVQQIMNQNLDWFRTTAHDLGLNTDQASKMYDAYSQFLGDLLTQQQDQVDSEMHTTTEELQKEYGAEFEAKMNLANRAIDEVGGEPLISLFEQNGLGRHPTVVKAFIKMGELMAEEAGLDRGDGVEGEDTMSLDDEIAAIQADPAYLSKDDPRHKGLVVKMQNLMKRRYPEPAQPAGTTRVF